jgi:hypothetical protein
MKPIAQEQGMGCGVACVASKLGISYKKAINLFDNPEHSADKGYMLKDLAKAIQKIIAGNLKIIKTKRNMRIKIGDIVFISWPEPY